MEAGGGTRVPGRSLGRRRSGHSLAGLLQSERNVKSAAATGPALHTDAAAHGADELRADRQPQPGTAVAARDGAIRLHKGIEDSLLAGFGNADSSVAH